MGFDVLGDPVVSFMRSCFWIEILGLLHETSKNMRVSITIITKLNSVKLYFEFDMTFDLKTTMKI